MHLNHHLHLRQFYRIPPRLLNTTTITPPCSQIITRTSSPPQHRYTYNCNYNHHQIHPYTTKPTTPSNSTTTHTTNQSSPNPNPKPSPKQSKPSHKQLPPRPTLPDTDLKHVYLKGSGPGGQKINKTSSAVQLTHLPTGIVVKSQATRSQKQNHKIAKRILAEKIELIEKGGESRVAKKIELLVKRKKGAGKKKRRKYRALAEAAAGEVSGIGGGRSEGGGGAGVEVSDGDEDEGDEGDEEWEEEEEEGENEEDKEDDEDDDKKDQGEQETGKVMKGVKPDLNSKSS